MRRGRRAVRIAIASDHAGYRYKRRIAAALAEAGHEVVDFGADSEAPADYPPLVRAAAESVASGECERGQRGRGTCRGTPRRRRGRCSARRRP